MWNAPARARLRSSGVRLRFGGHSKVNTQWQVLTSNAGLSGDVLFLKGAVGQALDVSVGASYKDRGIRNDDHDFFGVALSIPMTDKEPRGQKRQELIVIKKCVLKFRGCVLRGCVLRVCVMIVLRCDCVMFAFRTAPARPSPSAF